jgi:hypothetical protein
MISPDLYAQWRARSWAAHTLAERTDGFPLTEQLLQLVWLYQRLRRDQLQTTTGDPVKILHPGFWNHEPGPDFRGAVIELGQAPALSGDIEVDLSINGWRAHHHDQNPAFRRVILHVVWEADPKAAPALPTLVLKDRLDAPLEELGLWLRKEPRPAPAGVLGQCFNPLRTLPADGLSELLQQAARIRLQAKAGQFQARAKQIGWEWALWEGLFGALGYKHNVWPMRRIAELLPVLLADDSRPASALTLQARLLGVSGLLPSDVRQMGPTNAYLRNIWNIWWREREQFADIALPRALWRLGGLRPANNPQRRLALAAHWLAQADLPARLEQWFAAVQPKAKLIQSLLEVLQIEQDEFWSEHWTFRSVPLRYPQPLIGAQRVTDLAMNVILPWFWVRAAVGQHQSLQQLAEDCYFAWPKAEDNAVLRLARRRFFGLTEKPAFNTAAMQQAILQIVRDFCDYSNALCANCQFPGRVQGDVVRETGSELSFTNLNS